MKLEVIEGDITKLEVDAVASAANNHPLEECAGIVVETVRGFQPAILERVVFAVFGGEAERAFRDALARE